jgi:hypothetical protein
LVLLSLAAIPVAYLCLRPSSFSELAGDGGSDDGTLVFDGGKFPRFSPDDFGDELSAEQFVAITENESSTQLVRQTFRKSANGAPVNWLLRLEELSQRNGDDVEGHFTLPYRVVQRTGTGTRSRGSAVSVVCRFSDESLNKLLTLRKGDWARVRGRISFDEHSVTIEDARMGEDSEVNVEAPLP